MLILGDMEGFALDCGGSEPGQLPQDFSLVVRAVVEQNHAVLANHHGIGQIRMPLNHLPALALEALDVVHIQT